MARLRRPVPRGCHRVARDGAALPAARGPALPGDGARERGRRRADGAPRERRVLRAADGRVRTGEDAEDAAQSSSLELSVLLQNFKKMLIALRFGSDKWATGSQRKVAVMENNLSACELVRERSVGSATSTPERSARRAASVHHTRSPS